MIIHGAVYYTSRESVAAENSLCFYYGKLI